ncbi:AAA family ATPase [Streptomyces phaeofaciens]|uniref:AAA family ATPase n=1 Tax=Streptomyces phaeofaciens TaxID=68254 RepID=UPI00368D01EA
MSIPRPAEKKRTRRYFVAIATADYDDPAFEPLEVDTEVQAMREWLCADALGERAFTPAYPHLADNPTEDAIRVALRNPPPERRWREADTAVVYVTGHGIFQDRAHWTVLQATESNQLATTALRTVDLIAWLKETDIQNLFLVLDQCFAGNTVAEVAGFDKELPDKWLVLPSATRGREVLTGALTQAVTAFLAELKTREGEAIAGPTIPLLNVEIFLQGVRDKLGGDQQLQLLPGSQQTGPHQCLPNPHYRAEALAPVQRSRADLALPREDLEAHWEPRHRGVAQVGDAGWLFTGRQMLSKALLAAASGSPGATVVTGGAGSGKSAALARLVTFSDPAFRAHYRSRLEAVPADLQPAAGSVDVAVLATGKTAPEIIAQLCGALDVPAPASAGATPMLQEWITAWQQWLATRSSPVTVVVDGLEEATDAASVLIGVLARLDPHRQRVRLLVGVRSPGGEDDEDPAARPKRGMPLADQAERALSAQRIRVDEAPWWSSDDLADYAASILTATPNSPYTTEQNATAVAHTLAAHAGRSFLITRIAAANLAARPAPVKPDDQAWLNIVDDGILGVVRADLHTHRPDEDERLTAVHLLRAVAFARGRGLPWRRVWPALANAVANDPDRTYGDGDIANLLASPLAGYLTTDTADGATVYRLFHYALRTTLRDHWHDLLHPPEPAMTDTPSSPDARATEARITRRLLVLANDALDEDDAALPAYLRRHLVEHAQAAGLLDRRILRPPLLPHLDAGRLRSTVGSSTPDASDGLWQAFRHATHQWDFTHPAHNAAALEVQAALLGTPLTEPTLPGGWRVSWAITTRAQGERLGAHAGPVTSVAAAVLPDDRALVVSGGEDGTVRVWDLATGQRVGKPMTGHSGHVASVAAVMLPDGRAWAVSGGQDGTVRVWDVDTGQSVCVIQADHGDFPKVAAVVLPDGRALAVSGGYDGTVRVWDLATGQRVGKPMTGHRGWVLSVTTVVLPDGPAWAVSGGQDGTVRVWDLAKMRHAGKPMAGIDEWVVDVAAAVRPDGSMLAVSGGRHGTVQVWDLMARRAVSFPSQLWGPTHQVPMLPGHTKRIRAVAALAFPDGRALAVSASEDETVRTWNLATGQKVGTPLTGHDDWAAAASAVVLRNGRALTVTGGRDGAVRAWDLAATQPADTSLSQVRSGVLSVATVVLPDGRALALGGGMSGVQVWDLATGQGIVTHLTSTGPAWVRVGSVATVVAHGRPLAVASDDSGIVWVWDLETNKLVGKIRANDGTWVRAVSAIVVPDGRALAVSAGAGGRVRVWDLATGQEVGAPLTGHGHSVDAVSAMVMPDGRALAVSGGWDGTVRVWDLAAGREAVSPVTGHDGVVEAVSAVVLPDGRALAVSGGYDGTVRVWDLAAGREAVSPVTGHDGAVEAVSAVVLPDGRALAVSGGRDGIVRVWDLSTGQLLGPPLPVDARVTGLSAVCISGDALVVLIGTQQSLVVAQLPTSEGADSTASPQPVRSHW